jgi:hypothetical protein
LSASGTDSATVDNYRLRLLLQRGTDWDTVQTTPLRGRLHTQWGRVALLVLLVLTLLVLLVLVLFVLTLLVLLVLVLLVLTLLVLLVLALLAVLALAVLALLSWLAPSWLALPLSLPVPLSLPLSAGRNADEVASGVANPECAMDIEAGWEVWCEMTTGEGTGVSRAACAIPAWTPAVPSSTAALVETMAARRS